MNALILIAVACVAAVSAAPSGLGVLGPAGIITGVGPIGVGWGAGWNTGAALVAPSASAIISGPALVAPGIAAPLGIGLGGIGAITAGGGAISATAHGAAIRGPPTAPVVVSGPSGTVAADGLWGPTANIGGLGALGAIGHIG